MESASWAVTSAGWLAIVAGLALVLMGALLVSAMFLGRGVPVSGAGLFVILSLGAGPLSMLIGATIIVSGFKLMAGFAWARMVLDVFSCVALCASIGWLIYSAMQLDHVHSVDVIQGSLFFLMTGAPAVALMLLLRSESIGRAITR